MYEPYHNIIYSIIKFIKNSTACYICNFILFNVLNACELPVSRNKSPITLDFYVHSKPPLFIYFNQVP